MNVVKQVKYTGGICQQHVTSIKFNIIELKDNLKLSLYTLEKGVTMNDEIVH